MNAGREEWLAPGKLVSLWDMLRVYAQKYLFLGTLIHDSGAAIFFREADGDRPAEPLSPEMEKQVRDTIDQMAAMCKELGLATSQGLLFSASRDLPQTFREWNMLTQSILAELSGTLFLFVPSHLTRFYENEELLSDKARAAFPSVHIELRQGGNCLAAGLNVAAVFHSMRAAEIGVRALAVRLKVAFPFPLDLAEWGNMLDQIEAMIKRMQALPRGRQKDKDLKFYSEAAVNFRYFKDAWRIRVSHARESYGEAQAISIFDHTREFFEVLATRLKE